METLKLVVSDNAGLTRKKRKRILGLATGKHEERERGKDYSLLHGMNFSR
jgi:hypothetical protein